MHSDQLEIKVCYTPAGQLTSAPQTQSTGTQRPLNSCCCPLSPFLQHRQPHDDSNHSCVGCPSAGGHIQDIDHAL